MIGRWKLSADIPMNTEMHANFEGEFEYIEDQVLLMSLVCKVYYINRNENFLEFAVTGTGSWKFEEGKYREKMNDDFKIEHLQSKDPRIGFEVARFFTKAFVPTDDPEWIVKDTFRTGNTLAMSAEKFSYTMTKIEPNQAGMETP